MARRQLAFGVCAAIAMVLGAEVAAAGNIPNGDFENATDLEFWLGAELAVPGNPGKPDGLAVAEEVSLSTDVLHLKGGSSFTWVAEDDPGNGDYPGYWEEDQMLASYASATYPYDPGDPDLELLPPPGMTALRFDAQVSIETIQSGGVIAPSLLVQVAYNDGVEFEAMYLEVTAAWDTYEIELPSLDTSLSVIIAVTATSYADTDAFPDGSFDGEGAWSIAEGWLDNFTFIPEPAATVLLAAGAAALIRRRR